MSHYLDNAELIITQRALVREVIECRDRLEAVVQDGGSNLKVDECAERLTDARRLLAEINAELSDDETP